MDTKDNQKTCGACGLEHENHRSVAYCMLAMRAEAAARRVATGVRVRGRVGWDMAGSLGVTLGPDVSLVGGQPWTPVKWDDGDDPDWVKRAAIEPVPPEPTRRETQAKLRAWLKSSGEGVSPEVGRELRAEIEALLDQAEGAWA